MKLARRILIVLASLVLAFAVMIAAFYGIEDWRGARAWEQCRHDLQARGESLDVAAFIPPMIPDDENLAMAPLFVRLFGYRVDPVTKLLTFPSGQTSSDFKDEISAMPRGRATGKGDYPRFTGDYATGKPYDLAGWQQYYRRRSDFPHAPQPQTPAEDVLLAVTKYDPIIDELAQAMAARPRTRFPINWTSPQPAMIALPHYNALICVTSTLRLRALANLNLGRDNAAMRDLTMAQRLIEIPMADPMIIAQLVSATESGLMLQPIWEGLRMRRWPGQELEQIKTELRRVDYLVGYQQAMRGERATFMCATADYFKAHGGTMVTIQQISADTFGTGKMGSMLRLISGLADLMPGGWYDQNKAFTCRFSQENAIEILDAPSHRVSLAKAQASLSAAQRVNMTPYTWMEKVAAPLYSALLERMAVHQADVDHAIIACALEQFYVDHQAYPGRLDDLTPAYLDHVPPDLIDGAPTRYRLTPDGRYLLYSVGWNGRDDGGQVAWQKEGLKRDNSQGDWVWQYQELQPPASNQRSK